MGRFFLSLTIEFPLSETIFQRHGEESYKLWLGVEVPAARGRDWQACYGFIADLSVWAGPSLRAGQSPG